MTTFKHHSITRDLTAGIILTVIIVSSIAIAFSYFNAVRDARKRLEARAADMADSLAQMLINSLWNFDEETARHIGTSYTYNESVTGIRILDSLGTVYYEPESDHHAPSIQLTRDVLHNDQSVGQVTLFLSTARFKDIRRQFVWSSAFIILINLICLIITIRLLLRRFLQKPIRYFSSVVERYSTGDTTLLRRYRPPAEFEPFLEVLTDMGEKISAQMTELRRSQQELEQRVDARTAELAAANRELEVEIAERRQAETERIRLQEQLQRAEKMEAIGMLAGGVAHDLNNILSGLVSYPELLLLDLPEENPLRKPIQTIQKSGKKAATIVEDMLTLARRGVAVSEILNLNQLITEYLNNPEHRSLIAYHPDVRIETRLAPDLFNISGSGIHLFKTIMNLVSNAAEAMPNGGHLCIITENRYVDRPIRGYDQVVEGTYATLIVSDTGAGIPLEDRERIFEPFYTKKVMGRSGTGLGMAVVWGAVKDHNGYIDLQSVEGEGTTFTLFFPATQEPPAAERSAASITDLKGQGERILIVDDVAEQRQIATALLETIGYAVDAAASGEEAVAFLKTHRVDLVVLDMIMDPGMDGLDTYKAIHSLKPRQRTIIASGFSETERVRAAQSLGAGAYIKKPYTLEKIALAVKAELNKPSPSAADTE